MLAIKRFQKELHAFPESAEKLLPYSELPTNSSPDQAHAQ